MPDRTATRRELGYYRLVVRGVTILLILTTLAMGQAWAETKVGVVVGGADGLRAQSERAVGSWLTGHGITRAGAPLNKDGINTLVNCLVLSDMRCARNVVEARATADDVVGILEQASGKGAKRSVQLSAYWIAKKHEVVSLQRTCDACTDAVLATTIDAMVADLAKLAPTMNGHVHVTSKPPGLAAMIDNQAVGTTPVDHAIAFGTHTVVISRDGHVVGEKQIDVSPGATLDVDIPVAAPVAPVPPRPVAVAPVEEHRSRAVVTLLGIGVAAIVTGAVLYAKGGPTGQSYMYRDLRPAGAITAGGGLVLAIIGTVLLVRHPSPSSAPDVALTSGGAIVGWTGSF